MNRAALHIPESPSVDSPSGIGAVALPGVAVCDMRAWPQSRHEESARGRDCARRALERLGFASGTVGRDDDGCPTWPEGACGSITHSRGYVAAAVARCGELRSIGIDAESRRMLNRDVVRHIAVTDEREWLRETDPAASWSVLFFSAKESVFKAWFAIARTWLDFHDVRVDFHLDTQSFTAYVSPAVVGAEGLAPPHVISGRYAFDVSHVYTFAAISHSSSTHRV